MDYVVGGVAALISGNVTPNRPRLIKRALTPTKHQPSPNVTPKSEFVEDRSIFLSPTMQKKKAIVKKSPKRIFENPDLEAADSNDGNKSLISPKAEKVKKHLKGELDGNSTMNKSIVSQKSPITKLNSTNESVSLNKVSQTVSIQNSNESTPKKKKKKRNSLSHVTEKENMQESESTNSTVTPANNGMSPKKMKQRRNSVANMEDKGNNKSKFISSAQTSENCKNHDGNVSNPDIEVANTEGKTTPKKKNRKRKKKGKLQVNEAKQTTTDSEIKQTSTNSLTSPKEDKVKKHNLLPQVTEKDNVAQFEVINTGISPKKMKQRRKSIADLEAKSNNKIEVTGSAQDTENCKNNLDTEVAVTVEKTPKKKNRKRKKAGKLQVNEARGTTEDSEIKEPSTEDRESVNKQSVPKKKKKKQKKTKIQNNEPQIIQTNSPEQQEEDSDDDNTESKIINPNAITNKDSDSEHESDDEIESENEEINKKVLDAEEAEESSEEEEEKVEKPGKKDPVERQTAEEIKRTVFVGNVPFSTKCKKEIKKIFSKHGQIETVRIRTVPIKDGRFTPKMAVIKSELHPERSTVNVYVKYVDPSSVEQALTENNTVLNEHHLRVSRSDKTGAEHDPRCSIFVGNLPFALEDEALRAKFENCGEIKSVRIVRDKKTNVGKGFGYVNFLSKDGVELALQLSEEDLTIKNRILRVKRSIVSNKHGPSTQNKTFQPRGQGNQQQDGRVQRNEQGNFNRHHQGNQGRFQRNDQGNQDRFNRQRQGNQGQFQRQGNQGSFDRQGPGNQGKFQRQGQGKFQRQDNGFQGRFQRQEGGNENGFQRNQKEEGDGAYRRILNKRKSQEGGEEPPNKRQKNINQPVKEKKTRKEFVGMTAEKKTKHKFVKGQKKKKALSEILTK